ncbi:homogentisate 1,2-dioxygenase [Bradyrhizobium jicamae]|uniref:homogentisate 1,2-dioxygenase n=1 Tax=Bradyrhizobium jicamae TaxID=280332 RepID=UPI001BAA3722|nr:homogentisate 1,2-dioxygenase [Bradyrhizobium jicamae]MBR0754410.1 homogentisate 1,2-dioxygenase [Bradyrhizobium jicamae]
MSIAVESNRAATTPSARIDSDLVYMSGFGNEFETESLPGALPRGQNSPQKAPYGLYSELISGTTFSAIRSRNRRTYMFRIHPSVQAPKYRRIDNKLICTPPFEEPPLPNNMRWDPFEVSGEPADFIDGLATMCGAGNPMAHTGVAIHLYRANRSMTERIFANNDGEMIVMPQTGKLRIPTEMGILDAVPGEFVVIPRGIRFRVELLQGASRGFVCENFGLAFHLPELGLIGSNGLANAADFMAPVAAYEDRNGTFQLVQKFAGNLWATETAYSPLDVVAWRGSLTPLKYNAEDFVALGTVSVDHPDPSIFCALTSPADPIGGPNVDMMILPPRWLVSEHSFRPPGFHRNSVCEVVTLIKGMHQGKTGGFQPGGLSIHNNYAPHGPDVTTLEMGREAELKPQKLEGGLSFMFETRYPLAITPFAHNATEFQSDVIGPWQEFKRYFSTAR